MELINFTIQMIPARMKILVLCPHLTSYKVMVEEIHNKIEKNK
jgi:hypothetical protein